METMQERLAKIMAQKRGFTDAILMQNKTIIEQIKSTQVEPHTVAVIESHRKHAEVYPAIIHYFLEMGFSVDLFCLKDHIEDNSLCRTNFEKFRQFSFPIMPESDEFFELMSKYQYIFVDTIFTHDGYNFISALDKRYMQKYNKSNVYCIDHDFVSIQRGVESIEQRMIRDDKIFVLRDGIEMLGKKLPFVVPSWFGNYVIPKKSEKTHFICVGGGWGYQNNLRNFKLLFESINKLIQQGQTDFDVTFIGATKEMLAAFLTPENESYLDIKGFPKFEELYEAMEKAHFICYNIDDSCNEYEKYLRTGITGSYSLSLAFAKPPVIFKPLVSAYNFDEISIPYGKNELSTAMRSAMNMTDEDYQMMCQKLKEFNQELMEKSIENLRKVMPYE